MKSDFFKFIAVYFLLGFSAFANQINLSTNSQDGSLYGCNAGIMHTAHSGLVCYDSNNPSQSCDPQACSDGEACNCVCTGSPISNSDLGEYRLDYLKATYMAWTDSSANSSVEQGVVKEAGQLNFNQLFSNANAFENELSSLSLNLGSERYGAIYFLDACYRAPQTSSSSISYTYEKQATYTNFVNDSLDYKTLAGLQVKVVTYCKPKSGEWYELEETPWSGFISSNILNYEVLTIDGPLEACKVRFLFKESNREGLSSLRLFSMQESRVENYVSFEAVEEEEPGLCPSGNYYSFHQKADGGLLIQCHTQGGHIPYKYSYNYTGTTTHIQEDDNSWSVPGRVEPKYPGVSSDQCIGQYIVQPVNIPGEYQYVCTKVK